VILLLVTALAACPPPAHRAAAPPATQPGPDPDTALALVRIAQVFNDNYDRNDDGPAWDRWDARSQGVIYAVRAADR
jgi:hypothetical protein